MNLVFVYGTLKRGGSNHFFLRGQKFLGNVRTVAGFTLYSLGDYPGMVRALSDATGVTGELWQVDDTALAELDRLEGVDEGLYQRIDAPLAPNPFANSAQTYLYLRPIDGLAAIGPTWPVGPIT
jgi:gamma-glutamylaminecyclotransferase